MANLILDVKNLSKSFGAKVLLENVNFTITERQQVGLIAKNGLGKTTLLSVLAGDEGVDSGTIEWRNGVSVGILAQEPHFPKGASVIEACCHGVLSNEEVVMRAKQYLTVLSITDFDQPIQELSGGQQKRVALARVLTDDPDFLILDEPTNHLDLTMIEWLEGYLRWTRKTLLLVTHDRVFLERICDTILEIDNRTIFPYRGNYSYYLEIRQERLDAANKSADRVRNMYRRELEWMRATLMFTRKHHVHRVRAFNELKEMNRERIVDEKMRLEMKAGYIGSKVFEAVNISKAFGDKEILKDFNYVFSKGEKLGIVGDNGTGKSTFVKLLLGLVQPDSGHFDIGPTVKFGYYSQEGIKFDEQMRVIDAVRDIAEFIDLGDGKRLSAKQLLQYFLFSAEQQFDYIYKLSGGEKRRLYLCTVLMHNPNFLILDEPTNDLDIISLQALEEYLRDFQGCLIVISHDRYFMDKVVDHLLIFEGEGQLKDFSGNYLEYRQLQLENAKNSSKKKDLNSYQNNQNNSNTTPKSNTNKKDKATDPRNSSERDELDSAVSNPNKVKRILSFKEKREFEQLEKEIESLTIEKTEIETALSSGIASVEEITALSKRLPILTEELDQKELRWLELSELT